ncbi:hypothetical protein ACLMJK_004562 [Lecanora helva]
MPPSYLPRPPHPYRLFHLSARLRLRPSIPNTEPSQTPSPSTSTTSDDYYSLLLSSPLPSPSNSKTTINPLRAPKPSQPSSSRNLPPPTTIQASDTGPNNDVCFSRALEGPSARVRRLGRAEKGLERPKEPDNCCMSGCVNCVWDAYREEVEEWAVERRRREMRMGARAGPGRGESAGDGDGDGIGELDEPGRGFEGVDLSQEGMFEGVPVGIREFMNTEKRLRERRAVEKEGKRERVAA